MSCSPPISPLSPVMEGDGLSQLTALVQKGEKKGMFSQEMPPQIRRSVSLCVCVCVCSASLTCQLVSDQ